MAGKREALNAGDVRGNLNIRAGGPDGRCPGCGRLKQGRWIRVYVPGRPDEELQCMRCGYCGVLFEPGRAGDVSELPVALADLRRQALEARRGEGGSPDVADRLLKLRRRGVPLSGAAIEAILRIGDVQGVRRKRA